MKETKRRESRGNLILKEELAIQVIATAKKDEEPEEEERKNQQESKKKANLIKKVKKLWLMLMLQSGQSDGWEGQQSLSNQRKNRMKKKVLITLMINDSLLW